LAAVTSGWPFSFWWFVCHAPGSRRSQWPEIIPNRVRTVFGATLRAWQVNRFPDDAQKRTTSFVPMNAGEL